MGTNNHDVHDIELHGSSAKRKKKTVTCSLIFKYVDQQTYFFTIFPRCKYPMIALLLFLITFRFPAFRCVVCIRFFFIYGTDRRWLRRSSTTWPNDRKRYQWFPRDTSIVFACPRPLRPASNVEATILCWETLPNLCMYKVTYNYNLMKLQQRRIVGSMNNLLHTHTRTLLLFLSLSLSLSLSLRLAFSSFISLQFK